MLIRYLLENNNKYKIPNDKEYDIIYALIECLVTIVTSQINWDGNRATWRSEAGINY